MSEKNSSFLTIETKPIGRRRYRFESLEPKRDSVFSCEASSVPEIRFPNDYLELDSLNSSDWPLRSSEQKLLRYFFENE